MTEYQKLLQKRMEGKKLTKQEQARFDELSRESAISTAINQLQQNFPRLQKLDAEIWRLQYEACEIRRVVEASIEMLCGKLAVKKGAKR